MILVLYLAWYVITSPVCESEEWTLDATLVGECSGNTLLLTVVHDNTRFRDVVLKCRVLVDSDPQSSRVTVVQSLTPRIRTVSARQRIRCHEKNVEGPTRLLGTVIFPGYDELSCQSMAKKAMNRQLQLTLHSPDNTALKVERDDATDLVRSHISICPQVGDLHDSHRQLSSFYEGAGRYGSSQNCQDTPCAPRWTDCYDTTKWEQLGALPQIRLAIFVDHGFLNRYKTTDDCISDIIGIIADCNELILIPQVGLYVKLDLIIMPGVNAGSKIIPEIEDRCFLPNKTAIPIGNMLIFFNNLKLQPAAFLEVTKRDLREFGLYHLLTDCYTIESQISLDSLDVDPQTIGIAYPGTVCEPNAVALTTFDRHGRTWKTVMHEIGHNLGAGHSFEGPEGWSRKHYGGIMDYGDGMLDGFYQIEEREKTNTCKKLRQLLDPTKSLQSTFSCISEYFGGKDEEFRWVILPSDVTRYPKSCTSTPLRIARAVTCVHSKTGSWAEDFNCDPEQRPLSMIINLHPARCQNTATSCGNGIVEAGEKCDDASDTCCDQNCSWMHDRSGCLFFKVAGAFVLLDSLFILRRDGLTIRYTPVPKIDQLRSMNPDTHWPSYLGSSIPDSHQFVAYLAVFCSREGNVYFFGNKNGVLHYVVFDHFSQRVLPGPSKFVDHFQFDCPDLKYAYYTVQKSPLVQEKAIFRCGTTTKEYTFSGPVSGRRGSVETVLEPRHDDDDDVVAMVEIPEIWEVPAPTATSTDPHGALVSAEIWTFFENGSVQEEDTASKTFFGPREQLGLEQGRLRCKTTGSDPFCKICSSPNECSQCDSSMIWDEESKKCMRLQPVNVADFTRNPAIGIAKPPSDEKTAVARLFPVALIQGHGIMQMVSGRCSYSCVLSYESATDHVARAGARIEEVAKVLREVFVRQYERISMGGIELVNGRVNISSTLILLDACSSDLPTLKEAVLSKMRNVIGNITTATITMTPNSVDRAIKVDKGTSIMLAPWISQGSQSSLPAWQLNLWLQVTTPQYANVFRIDDTVVLIAEILEDELKLSLGSSTAILEHTFRGKFINQWIQLAVRVSKGTVTFIVQDQQIVKQLEIPAIEVKQVEIGPTKDIVESMLPDKSVRGNGMTAFVTHIVLYRVIEGSPYVVDPVPLLPAMTAGILGAFVTVFAFINLFGYQLKPPKIE